MMPFKVASFCAVAAIVASVNAAQAAQVTYRITGNVDDIFDTYGSAPLMSTIVVGSPLDLTYTYDPSKAVYSNTLSGSVPTTAIYTAPTSYSLTLPGFGLSDTSLAVLYVANNSHYINDPALFDQESYAIGEIQVIQNALPFAFPSGSPYYEETFNFTFEDDSATALSSFDAPSALNGVGFSNRSIDVDFNSAQDGVIVRADGLNVTEVSALPEPSAWAVMFAGVIMVGGMLRRGRAVFAPKDLEGLVRREFHLKVAAGALEAPFPNHEEKSLIVGGNRRGGSDCDRYRG